MKKIHFTDRYLLNPRHPVTVFFLGFIIIIYHKSSTIRIITSGHQMTGIVSISFHHK